MHQKFTEILTHTIINQALFPANEVIVLAVSGGADSLALLHALATVGDALPNEYHVATLDHGLRGEDGGADAAFVCEQARRLRLPCTSGKVEVPQIARERKIGLEEAARIARYDFLGNLATQLGSTTVATAHHAGDQAETILMHIVRGAGLQGLRGMPYQTHIPGHQHLRLVRPLLDVPRSEIEAYCQEHDLEPRNDASNTDPTYVRNRIRLEILPQLRELNPQVNAALLRLANTAAEDERLLSEIFEREIVPQMKRQAVRFSWQIAQFLDWQPAMQSRAIRYALEYLGAHPEYEQVRRAREWAQDAHVGLMMPFNNRIRLRFGYSEMFIEREDAPLPQEEYLTLTESRPVTLPGSTNCGSWQLITSRTPQEGSQGRLAISPDAIVSLRTRQPGDRWQPLGMGGHSRSLKKWMIDQKIPQQVRDQLPLLLINDEIAAVILPNQWFVAEPFAVRKSSQHVFYFSVRGLKGETRRNAC